MKVLNFDCVKLYFHACCLHHKVNLREPAKFADCIESRKSTFSLTASSIRVTFTRSQDLEYVHTMPAYLENDEKCDGSEILLVFTQC